MAKTTWTDETGSDWDCRVTIAEANRLRSKDDIDILNPDKLAETVSDPLAVIYMLSCIHAGQIEERGITTSDFAEICTASESVANAAADALIAALSDFFKRLRKPALAKVVEQAAAATQAAEKQALAVVSDRGRRVIDQVVAKTMQGVNAAIDAAERNATA